MKRDDRIIYAASERCADLLYITSFHAPDPFLWVRVGDQEMVVVSPLEFGRAVKQARKGIEVLSFAAAKKRFKARNAKPETLIAEIGRMLRVRRWLVPDDFPHGLAQRLSRRKIHVQTPRSAFFPERETKTRQEVAGITAGIRLAEAGLKAAVGILRQARIRNGMVYTGTDVLTAETLRGEIEATISRLGGIAAHTIVAPGRQGADPHNAGFGPIAADQTLIIDIFPRVTRTGYFGDLTRTLVKGKAPRLVKKAFAAVRKARNYAQSVIREGASGKAIHDKVTEMLTQAGFDTDAKANPPVGFFHGTGHGLGLEIHEPPRVSTVDQTLVSGHVVTVEPGVYYPEWGGVRLEDVVVVQKRGCRTLTAAPSVLEIS